MKKVIILLMILSVSCCLKSSHPSETLIVMSWNVQNLFDGKDDGNEYDDFSVSKGKWSSELYQKRLKLLSRVILLNNPDIVALQEIEGEQVLIDFRDSYLSEYKYIVSTKDSGAIQLGFLSKHPIESVGYIDPNKKDYRLRSLLEVTFYIDDGLLTVINNHWKSKRGGFTENLRLESSIALKRRLSQLTGRDVVVVGDLNENYNEYQKVGKSYHTALMFNETGKGITIRDGKLSSDDSLYTTWPDSSFPGSYRYRGEWETIDHALVSRSLLDKSGLFYQGFSVDSRSLLFKGEEIIYRWDSITQTGFSDHLPVLLKLGQPRIQVTLE